MTAAWSWADVAAAKPHGRGFVYGASNRPSGGLSSRFVGTPAAKADIAAASLRAGHPAVVEGRTLFPTRVFDPDQVDRLLVSGHNSAKIGVRIEKGPWRGLPMLTLTLEERATCPASCGLWRACFGNGSPMARRHRAGPDLIVLLGRELRALARVFRERQPHGA